MRDPNQFMGAGATPNVPNVPNFANVNVQGNNPPPQPAPNLAPQNPQARAGNLQLLNM